MSRRAPTSYTAVQIGLHWLIAALVIFQLAFGGSMRAAVRAAERGEQPSGADAVLAGAHYWTGLSILGLVVVRLGLRVLRDAPAATPQTPRPLALLAELSHWVFYALLVAMPVTGLLAYYVNENIGRLHTLGKPAFIVLIAMHIAATLFHQFVLRDGTLSRMVRPAR